ncbi:MAG TPA: hypothetical protein VIU38_02765 [Anaerolineales bacterium]
MRSDKQLFGTGMLIGATVAAGLMLLGFFVATVVPQASTAPSGATSTAAPLGTLATKVQPPSPTLTFTPIPPHTVPTNLATDFYFNITPTPDPLAAAITSGAVVFSGPLSAPEQLSIYRASLNYAQASVAASKQAAKDINGVGYGDPTNICGPLAAAILRDAAVIGFENVPHDFWLLDPRTVTGQRILAKAFPVTDFVHLADTTPINKVNWNTSPLQPGDFVFIWHGSGGNFDHMLTVSRVDRAGRTFAVTNYGTPEGYVIAETMLYDPNDPKAGIFYTWTKERDAILGSTGFGGFEIWRARRQ